MAGSWTYGVVADATDDSVPQHTRRPRNRQGEYSGVIKSWIKRATASISKYLDDLIAFKPQRRITKSFRRPSTRWKYVNGRARRNGHSNLARVLAMVQVFTSTAHPRSGTIPIAKRARFDSDSDKIRIDNHASACISPNLRDFVGPVVETSIAIRGYHGKSRRTVKKGTIKWLFEDDDGRSHCHMIKDSLFDPDAPSRILSPQHWARSKNDKRGTGEETLQDSTVLFWNQRQFRRTIPLDPRANVPILTTSPGFTAYAAFCAECETDDDVAMPAHIIPDDDETASADEAHSVDSADEESLTPGNRGRQDDASIRPTPVSIEFSNIHDGTEHPNVIEEDEELKFDDPRAELLHYHHRLGHMSFRRLKLAASLGCIPKRLKDVKPPKCTACLFSKATRRPWRTKAAPTGVSVPTPTAPGAVVSVDQLESSTPGLIGQLKGWLTRKRYTTATVFVDHFSDLGFVYLQKSTSMQETIDAKEAFERYAAQHGVSVHHYHGDNGRFQDNDWTRHLAKHGQTMSFSGVGAHFQNGVAEKRIRDLQDAARTMILHSQRRWPNAIDAHLWPYAVRLACDIDNNTPRIKTAETPIERFSSIPVQPRTKHYHHFGCPVYVLDGDIQQGKKGKKWANRSRVGIYLGNSPRHARSVALVLNLATGLVSPQYHVTFDDAFETSRKGAASLLPNSQWQERAGFRAPPATNRAATPLPPDPSHIPPSQPLPAPRGSTPHRAADDDQSSAAPAEPETAAAASEGAPAEVPAAPEGAADQAPTHAPMTTTRSGRTVRPPERLNLQTIVAFETLAMGIEDIDDSQESNPVLEAIAMAASSNPDIMYVDEALRAPDREKFIEAMESEIKSHTDNKHWKIVRRDQIPKQFRVLPAVWAMRRKRRLDTMEVYKWKARLNVHGGRQIKGIDYDETYSPVVQWTSTRFFLTLSVLRGWTCRQIDFVLAYPQAPVETDTYIEIPKGFAIDGDRKSYALKLLRNIYGAKDAGRVWNRFMTKKLVNELGFIQSSVDECVFYRGTCVVLIYVDDTIIMGPRPKEIEAVIQLLSNKFNISDEGTLADYLGVKIRRDDDGMIHMTQTHIIDDILRELQMSEATHAGKPTPALSTKILTRDEDGPEFDRAWDYRKVIGKLNYLEKATRPELAYAVHQCARFSANPKRSHAEAVERIGQYLLATRDKGMIMNPRGSEERFECWADAAFAGEWNRELAADDPSTAKSRTGYVLTYAGVPLTWASKLQTEIALSTVESEYIALSQAMREVLYVMQLAREAKEIGVPIFGNPTTQVKCKAFEDNTGALELANVPKMRPRTKHINIKYHHFRHHVGKDVTVEHVDTENQIADIFTKPLAAELFILHRKSLLGW